MISIISLNEHCIYFFKKLKYFSEDVMESVYGNEGCVSLCEIGTSVSLVRVNECSINEKQPGTIHIHIIMLYILMYQCRF